MAQLSEEQQPKMNAPDRIWLQPGQALDPTECTLSHAGTERVTAADVEYVRADLLDSDSQAAGDDAAGTRDEWKEFAEECKEGLRASHRVLDGFGVPREDTWLQETDGKNYGIEEVVEYPVHERIKMLLPFAATAMRDKCREVVLDYFTLTASQMIAKYGTHIPQDAIASLTLDQVKPEKQK